VLKKKSHFLREYLQVKTLKLAVSIWTSNLMDNYKQILIAAKIV